MGNCPYIYTAGQLQTQKPAAVATGFILDAMRGAEAVILKACLMCTNRKMICQCMIR